MIVEYAVLYYLRLMFYKIRRREEVSEREK